MDEDFDKTKIGIQTVAKIDLANVKIPKAFVRWIEKQFGNITNDEKLTELWPSILLGKRFERTNAKPNN